MPLSLLVLALSAFAIGTTEFVVMGLLPEVSHALAVSIPAAGWLISGYALSVAIGAPVMALLTAKMPRKRALLILMLIFIIGNGLCAIAASYGFLMFARIVTALCHGAFFGIGSVAAASLVPPARKASAVALMFTGLTLANVLGVPLGTALGQMAGWRMPFWIVALLGVASWIGLWRVLPKGQDEQPGDMRRELAALKDAAIWMALLTTVLFSAAMFALFTYVAPLVEQVSGMSPAGKTWTLFVIGIGLTLGNYAGGKLADWRLSAALMSAFSGMAILSATLHWTSSNPVLTEINLFLWAAAAFGAVSALQINVMTAGHGAPNLVSTLNIGAFNVGNALGAWVGGLVLEAGLSLADVPLAAAILAVAGFFCSRHSSARTRHVVSQQTLRNAAS